MKSLFLIISGFLLATSGYCQSLKDIYKSDIPLTWLGIDFTQLKVINDMSEKTTAAEISTKYMPGWNDLFLSEPKKYDVAATLDRNKVNYALDITQEANAQADEASILSNSADDYQLLSNEKIENLVGAYNFKDQKGIGMMIFMEGMDKIRERGSGWVTFVDMDNHKVLYTKRYTGKSGGFGFRNYWARSIREILIAFANTKIPNG